MVHFVCELRIEQLATKWAEDSNRRDVRNGRELQLFRSARSAALTELQDNKTISRSLARQVRKEDTAYFVEQGLIKTKSESVKPFPTVVATSTESVNVQTKDTNVKPPTKSYYSWIDSFDMYSPWGNSKIPQEEWKSYSRLRKIAHWGYYFVTHPFAW